MYRKGLELLLVFSLALNLAFVGVWGYHWFYVRPELEKRSAPVWQTQQGTLNLTNGQRQHMRERWGQLRKTVGGPKEELEAKRTRLIELLAAPEPDMEAIRDFWKQWPDIPAVKAGRVIVVDADLVTRPGPRIVDGLEIIARALHPEKFQ